MIYTAGQVEQARVCGGRRRRQAHLRKQLHGIRGNPVNTPHQVQAGQSGQQPQAPNPTAAQFATGQGQVL